MAEQLKSASPPFLAGLCGALLAWRLLNGEWLYLTLVLGFIAAGLITNRIGSQLLPCRPVIARWFMELWFLVPFASASGASALLIWLSGLVVETKNIEDQRIIAAIIGSITVFLSTVFLDPFKNESASGKRIREAFEKAYKDPFLKSRPDLRNHVFSLSKEWTLKERKKIAELLQEYVESIKECTDV